MKISKFINVKVTKSARGLEKLSKLKVGGMYLVLRSTLIYLSIFSFADDTHCSSSFSSNPQHLAYSNISPYRNTSASLLTNDFTNVEKWGNDNLVKFNQEKTTQVVISRKYHQDVPLVFMNDQKLDISSSFTQLGLSISSNLTWNLISIPLQSMHLRNLAFFLEPVAISPLLNY